MQIIEIYCILSRSLFFAMPLFHKKMELAPFLVIRRKKRSLYLFCTHHEYFALRISCLGAPRITFVAIHAEGVRLIDNLCLA